MIFQVRYKIKMKKIFNILFLYRIIRAHARPISVKSRYNKLLTATTERLQRQE